MHTPPSGNNPRRFRPKTATGRRPIFPPPPRPVIDLEPSGLDAWRERIIRYLRCGFRQRGLFLLAFWGVTAGYIALILAVILVVIW